MMVAPRRKGKFLSLPKFFLPHPNLYKWNSQLGKRSLGAVSVPNHSTFSKNRHGRFRDSDLFRWLFNEQGKARRAKGAAPSQRYLGHPRKTPARGEDTGSGARCIRLWCAPRTL